MSPPVSPWRRSSRQRRCRFREASARRLNVPPRARRRLRLENCGFVVSRRKTSLSKYSWGVAKGDPARAIRRAAVGLRDRCRDRQPRSCRLAHDLDGVLGEHGAMTVEDDEVGRAVALAGNDANPPGWIVRSAMSGLPITTVDARSGSCMILAWSRNTTIGSAAVAGATRVISRMHRGQPIQQAQACPRSRAQRHHRYSPKRYATTNNRRGLYSRLLLHCKIVKEVQIGRAVDAPQSSPDKIELAHPLWSEAVLTARLFPG